MRTSIRRSSSNGVPSNSTAGGKKSDSDGAWNSPAAKVMTLSVLSRSSGRRHGHCLRFDRTLTIKRVDKVGSRIRQPLRTV